MRIKFLLRKWNLISHIPLHYITPHLNSVTITIVRIFIREKNFLIDHMVERRKKEVITTHS